MTEGENRNAEQMYYMRLKTLSKHKVYILTITTLRIK